MPPSKDITGERFGRLVVLSRAGNRGVHTAWLCQCDCGNQHTVNLSSLRSGLTRSCGCLHREAASKTLAGIRKQQVGKDHPNWKGGRRLDPNGYIQIVNPDKPGKRLMEHRAIVEQAIGRPLLGDETVHHKNGIRDDNRPENLELWNSGHPKGQRIADKVAWAKEILRRYDPSYSRVEELIYELKSSADQLCEKCDTDHWVLHDSFQPIVGCDCTSCERNRWGV